MGKTIDRAALHVLATLALYLFFVSAFGDIWLAAGCALCALLLLRKLLSPVSRRRFGGLRGLHKGGQAKPRKISDMRALLCRVKSL